MATETNTSKVTVYHHGSVIAIIAEPGWTETDWDAAVPDGLDTSWIGGWNYRVVDGRECWTIDVKEVNRI